MPTVEKLMGSLLFFFPPGPSWRAFVPLLAAAWTLTFGVGPPLVIWRLSSWNDAAVRRAAISMWAALLPTVAFALEYAVRTLARAPGGFVVSAFAFIPNLVAPFCVIKSFLDLGPMARPVSFQVARVIGGVAWLGTWALWLTMTGLACAIV